MSRALEKSSVLMLDNDHTYWVAHLTKKMVVQNLEGEYSEFVGLDYLEDGDKVVEMWVVD